MKFSSIQQKANYVHDLLKREYPIVITPLNHEDNWQLLIATMLSAQTLDTTVNKVTPALFKKYPTMQDLSKAHVEDVEVLLKGVNYYKTKSKNVIKTSKSILEDFKGTVPLTIEELITLPGVGRKTANVVIGQKAEKPEGFVVDTHVKRVAKRLGFTKHQDPVKVEQDLIKLFPQKEWDDVSLRFIFHGRNRCKARNNTCCEHEVWRELCEC